MIIWTLKCKSGAIKVTMNGIIKSMVGFKVYIVEILGRNLSQILADEAEMIKPYSTHDQGKSNFLRQKKIPENLQQCSVCDPGEIFLTSKFSCLVFSNWAPHKTKTGTPNR
jgi:hypothetical protein